jgi:iron complex outermembrane recepter protein
MKLKPNPGRWWRRNLLAAIGGGLLVVGAGLGAAEAVTSPSVQSLRQLSFEELLNLEVSVASRKEQRLTDTAAAVSVLTGDDIRRSGVTHLAEALRLVPGVQVARLNGHKWAISIRGFNGVFANKLLVLMDGRSVYTPLFSGTLWEYQDVSLESIDRIEVVRGPGASVWGANAVNGVINIITKSARDSHGSQVSVGGGTIDHFIASASHGSPLSEDASIRFDAGFRQRGEMEAARTGDEYGELWSATGRFRTDWEPADTTSFTLLGGGQYGEFDERTELFNAGAFSFVPTDITVEGATGHLLGRWTRTLDERSEIEVQSYLEVSEINASWIRNQRVNYDVELNHRWQPGERFDLNWGLGYRLNADQITTTGDTIFFSDEERTDHLFSGYLQNVFQLVPEVLSVTAGVRLEHNDYTGFEVQPTLRGLWKPVENQSLWASVSRAVRTPSRAETDSAINLSLLAPGEVHPLLPALLTYEGSRSLESEELWAFELGYRWQATERLHLDAATFYNVYENLRGSQMGTPFPNDPLNPAYIVIPLGVVNDTKGTSWGGELSTVWQAQSSWRLRLGYSYLNLDLTGSDAAGVEGWSPRHQLFLQSLLQVTEAIELDATLRWVDELSGPAIPSYVTADVRVGWRPNDRLELSIVGQNLFDSPHQEFESQAIRYQAALISRSVFGKLTWNF